MVGAELQGGPQRLLVAGGHKLFEFIDLVVGYQFGDEFLHSVLALGTDKTADDLPVVNGEYRWDRLHPEGLGHTRIFVDVHFGQHHTALAPGDHPLQDGAKALAGPTPGRPKVHHNRNLL